MAMNSQKRPERMLDQFVAKRNVCHGDHYDAESKDDVTFCVKVQLS